MYDAMYLQHFMTTPTDMHSYYFMTTPTDNGVVQYFRLTYPIFWLEKSLHRMECQYLDDARHNQPSATISKRQYHCLLAWLRTCWQLVCHNLLQWRIQDFEKGGSYYLVHEEGQKFLFDHVHF